MTNQEIENYINTYRVYPDEYKGKRDTNILLTMTSSFKYNPKDHTITRTEGRINDNGDFELVGSFTFPFDKLCTGTHSGTSCRGAGGKNSGTGRRGEYKASLKNL